QAQHFERPPGVLVKSIQPTTPLLLDSAPPFR
ncbi:MAG: hypothetical protein ACI91J_002280, partial [Yoonia sp.]